MKKEAIIQYIQTAFDGVEQPKEITLHVAEAHDDYDYEHNEEHRKKDFIGPWQEVPAADIKHCQTALSYLDAAGLRFYLPAYMVWYLKNFNNPQEVTSDHTLYSLSGSTDKRFTIFTPEQLKACALFVKYCAEDATGFTDDEFARKKYEKYWAQFDK